MLLKVYGWCRVGEVGGGEVCVDNSRSGKLKGSGDGA